MKKKILIGCIAVVLLAAILFVPIPRTYDDGGTREYSALTYRIVQWDRLVSVHNEDGVMVGVEKYKATSVYFFPDNFKSLQELWETEYQYD